MVSHVSHRAPRFALVNSLRRFREDQDGSATVMTLFLLVPMLMMGGFAIDLMRYEQTRTQLQNTLDRCTLMAATIEQRLDPESVVTDCVTKGGFGSALSKITVVEGDNERDVKVQGRVETKPFFMHMIGIDQFDAKAVSAASQGITNVEIALVLDVSGSMSGAKIAKLKTAASEFVDTMINSDPNHRISIAIVPYNAQVNLGSTLRSKYNAVNQHGVANVNCLELPTSVYTNTNLSRTLALPMMAYADHAYGTNTINGYVAPTDATAVPNYGSAFCRAVSANIVRLPSQNATDLKAQINGLQAGGNTSIMLGMKWGLTLLDPGARGMYSELISENQMAANLSGRPYDYTDANTMKVIVLMTDGEHVAHDRITDNYKTGLSPIYRSSGDGEYSIYHATRPAPNRYYYPKANQWLPAPWTNNGVPAVQQDWKDIWAHLKMSYVAWQFYGRALGTNNATRSAVYNAAITDMRAIYATVPAMDAQLQQSCALAKQNKVIVYGIAFQAPANGQQQISTCASSTKHYYDAQEDEAIVTAFRSIASNLTQLRLTQ